MSHIQRDRRLSHTQCDRRLSRIQCDRRLSYTQRDLRLSHIQCDGRLFHTQCDRRLSHIHSDRRLSHLQCDRRLSHTQCDKRSSHIQYDRRSSHIPWHGGRESNVSVCCLTFSDLAGSPAIGRATIWSVVGCCLTFPARLVLIVPFKTSSPVSHPVQQVVVFGVHATNHPICVYIRMCV